MLVFVAEGAGKLGLRSQLATLPLRIIYQYKIVPYIVHDGHAQRLANCSPPQWIAHASFPRTRLRVLLFYLFFYDLIY